jgi:hypothetical protein
MGLLSGEKQGDDMTEEHKLMNEIRIALSKAGCVTFRVNVGKMRTPDGRYFNTGVPVGFSDIFGFRQSDGRAFFIEVKTKSGRVSPAQKQFIETMQFAGAIAGVCRSTEEALSLIYGGK